MDERESRLGKIRMRRKLPKKGTGDIQSEEREVRLAADGLRRPQQSEEQPEAD